jgi:hypothetical protein
MKVAAKRNRQFAPPSGLATVGPAPTWKFTGRLPRSAPLLTVEIGLGEQLTDGAA